MKLFNIARHYTNVIARRAKRSARIATLIMLGSLTSISCDDMIDIEPEYSLDAENFFKSPNDYQLALTAVYDLLQTSYLDMWISEIASDNAIAGGESVTDTEGLHQIDAMTHGGTNTELRSLFRFMYAGIARANYLLENKDRLDFDGKARIIAEARFLRAYYYFELVKFFGDVPYFTRRLSASEVSSQDRTPAAEVYSKIEEDLVAAAEDLEWTTSVKGRVTKGAALSLLGKAYLYQDKFEEAAEVLDEVINDGPYDLYPDYAGMFRVANESNNSETVFDIEYVGSEGGSYGCFVCLEGFVAVGFHGIRGYNGPIYADGNSYNLPTQDLVDEFEPGDPRLAASILDIDAFIASQPEPDEIEYVEGGGGHTGYYNNKYLKRQSELGSPDNDLTSPVNHKVIRYADVLLMAAEAHNRKTTANDVLARQYLNAVRSRTSVNMPAVNSSGAALTQAIWHERRVEFAGEGLHFFDLVRTGRAAAQIPGFTSSKNELFPLPQDEIDLAGAGWDQNPGYNN
jgi:tetratricopeptide (TPR) repeat protein